MRDWNPRVFEKGDSKMEGNDTKGIQNLPKQPWSVVVACGWSWADQFCDHFHLDALCMPLSEEGIH